MGIEYFLTKGSVYLDTNVSIYALEDFPEYAVPLHLTTADFSQCCSFLTNDRRLFRQKFDNLEILLLENFL